MAELLIAAGVGEWRAVWIEDGEARELYVERGDTKPPGSRHLGRVLRVVPALDAAMVDIGDERSGFLPLREVPVGRKPEEGAQLVVEVRREAWQDKGPRLSAKLDDLSGPPSPLDPPAQLFPAPGLVSALRLRLAAAPERVTADDSAILGDLRRVFRDADIARRDPADWPADLDALFAAALAPSLALPQGGTVHFDEGRAATLIDVDTGTPLGGSSARAALATNRHAARLIAQELRRRQIGGSVVIDFVGLDRRDHREQVLRTLEAALADDPMKPRLHGWTRLGHLELTRPRRQRSLADAMLEPATRTMQPLALAHEALRRLLHEARANPAANWRLSASPAVEAALRGRAAAAVRALEERLGRRLTVVPTARPEGFDIAPD